MNESRIRTPSDQQWRIAKVADPSLARRCIGRLESGGFEYQVVADNSGKSRILVRRNQLGEIAELLDDLDQSPEQWARNSGSPADYRQQVRLLLAIPLGGGIGLALSALIGIPASFGTVLPALCAGLFAFLAALSGHPKFEPKGF